MPIINQVVQGGGSSGPVSYIEKIVDASGWLQNSTNIINLGGATDINSGVLTSAYKGNLNISGVVDFSSLTKISGSNALDSTFNTCTNITGLDLRNVTEISGMNALNNCCYQCTHLTNLNLSSLKKVTGQYALTYMCANTQALEIFSLPVLEIINADYAVRYMCYLSRIKTFSSPSLVVADGKDCLSSICQGDSLLTTVELPSLKYIPKATVLTSAFQGATALTSLSFPALTTNSFGSAVNQFQDMCKSITNITVHFPANIQSIVEGLTGYSTTAPFSAAAGTVLFDLPSTVILTGANTVEYERNPKYDTATALAWRVKDTGTAPNLVIDWTPYYTSGTTDPTANDTIYSDATCTTTVTTISSIA